jgi:hypothetical protein
MTIGDKVYTAKYFSEVDTGLKDYINEIVDVGVVRTLGDKPEIAGLIKELINKHDFSRFNLFSQDMNELETLAFQLNLPFFSRVDGQFWGNYSGNWFVGE